MIPARPNPANAPIKCPKCGWETLVLYGKRWLDGRCSNAYCTHCPWKGAVQLGESATRAKTMKITVDLRQSRWRAAMNCELCGSECMYGPRMVNGKMACAQCKIAHEAIDGAVAAEPPILKQPEMPVAEPVETGLPILETVCDNCDGAGCVGCDGRGYFPTEAGEAILNLIRHNARKNSL